MDYNEDFINRPIFQKTSLLKAQTKIPINNDRIVSLVEGTFNKEINSQIDTSLKLKNRMKDIEIDTNLLRGSNESDSLFKKRESYVFDLSNIRTNLSPNTQVTRFDSKITRRN